MFPNVNKFPWYNSRISRSKLLVSSDKDIVRSDQVPVYVITPIGIELGCVCFSNRAFLVK